MNWRRGLFRLWIVGAAIFVIAVAAISYSSFEAEFSQAAETRGLIAQIEAAQPNKTFELKLPDGRRVEIQKPDRQSAVEDVPEILTSLGYSSSEPLGDSGARSSHRIRRPACGANSRIIPGVGFLWVRCDTEVNTEPSHRRRKISCAQ
jgi:hypothetical protein